MRPSGIFNASCRLRYWSNTVKLRAAVSTAGNSSEAPPLSLKEALSRSPAEAAQWKDANDREFASMVENEVGEVVPRKKSMRILGSKVIFKIKGHKNETLPLRGSLSEDLAHVICGSEDGDVYIWS